MSDQPDLLTISQICRRLPGARGARNVTPSTVTRWILLGCPARSGERVRLAATRAGSRWLIRLADLDAFFAALAGDAGTPSTPTTLSPRSERKALERAARAGAKLVQRGA
jgi:hypothetical protein